MSTIFFLFIDISSILTIIIRSPSSYYLLENTILVTLDIFHLNFLSELKYPQRNMKYRCNITLHHKMSLISLVICRKYFMNVNWEEICQHAV